MTTIEETLRSLPAFQRLQPQQQTACLRYCQNGRDAKDAAVEAYPVPPGEGQVKRLAKSHKDFMSCVDAIYGPEEPEITQEEFRLLLCRMIRRLDKDSLKAAEMYREMKGSTGADPPDPPNKDYAAELAAFESR